MSRSTLYAGLMSGTSLDGIDAVLVDFAAANPVLVQKHYHPYDAKLRQQLLSLHQPQTNELVVAQQISNELAQLYAQTLNTLLEKANLAASAIAAVGCHGQTIRHNPQQGWTLQLGNGALLAELTGITVINDFRSRDIAAGGQGAPLVPAFHQKVLAHPNIHRVIVNIGGISNLTELAPGKTVQGFDCGPGNLLMDSWCQQHLDQTFDANGAWAAQGRILSALLEELLQESFFDLPPPKSTGRDLFNQSWLQHHLKGNEQPVDVQATLLELSCQSISRSILQHCPGTQEVYLCGGGARNQALSQRLQQLLPSCQLANTQTLGVDPDYLEAFAFAWLAQQTLQQQPGNLPAVTGAKGPRILGAIHFA